MMALVQWEGSSRFYTLVVFSQFPEESDISIIKLMPVYVPGHWTIVNKHFSLYYSNISAPLVSLEVNQIFSVI